MTATAPLPTRPGHGRSPARRRRAWHAGRSALPDAGSLVWGLVALLAAMILIPIVIYRQQSTIAKMESDWAKAQDAAGPDGPIMPPGFDQFTITTKAFLKINEAMRAEGSAGPWSQEAFADGMLDPYAITLTDQVRLAVVKGELTGPKAALDQLSETGRFIEPQGELWGDVAALEALYRGGADVLSDDERAGLIERHGWYGKVALTFGADKSDPARQALLGGGWPFIWSMALIMLVLGAGFIASMTLFLLMLVRIATGQIRLRFEMPAPGGSVYLETFAVFLAAFLGLLAVSARLEDQPGRTAEWAMLLGPWAIAPVIFWPLLRGVSWKRYRAEIGWHRGEGVLKEMGCGIAAYLASIPVYIAVVIVMVLLAAIWMAITNDYDQTTPPAQFPIDLAGEHRWLMLAGLMSLLTIWAPLIEETVFRGALMRHLTSRMHWLVAAALTAAVFGAIHPYLLLGIVPVAFLGFVFALMRRWRGSLIASMTAHALHNGTIGTILVVILLLVAE
jgi:membrane protease YdiL (CAAX protease family)